MFIRYISHEIRTPLNTVCLGLKLMFDDFTKHGESRSRLENLSDIRESCDTAVNILNELLTLDKLESGILMLEKKPVLAWSFVSEIVRPFAVQVREEPSISMSYCGPSRALSYISSRAFVKFLDSRDWWRVSIGTVRRGSLPLPADGGECPSLPATRVHRSGPAQA